MTRTSDYENMICECERILNLLNFVFEELDDAPHYPSKEDVWKAVVYANRSEMTEALIYSIHTMIQNQKEVLKTWIEEDIKK